jgi:polyisoprenoid-binding protein YceI
MKWTLRIAICLLSNYAIAQYRPVQSSSLVQFTVKYFGVEARGTVAGLSGDITWGNGGSLVDCKFDVSVEASTIQTGVELRDHHLLDSDFLDAANYPRIRFISSKVEATSDPGTFIMHGMLTIKDHRKEIFFPFTATPLDNGYLFKGSFQISRKDFEVGNSAVIADNILVTMNVSTTR